MSAPAVLRMRVVVMGVVTARGATTHRRRGRSAAERPAQPCQQPADPRRRALPAARVEVRAAQRAARGVRGDALAAPRAPARIAKNHGRDGTRASSTRSEASLSAGYESLEPR